MSLSIPEHVLVMTLRSYLGTGRRRISLEEEWENYAPKIGNEMIREVQQRDRNAGLHLEDYDYLILRGAVVPYKGWQQKPLIKSFHSEPNGMTIVRQEKTE